MADKIKDDIYWIGVDNPEGRDFHGISTPRGGSYNSFLIIDDKPAIIDGTNKKFLNEYIKSLKAIIDPEKVQYIIINHCEPDHTGAIKEITDQCKNAKIVCSEKGKEFVEIAFGVKNNFIVVKEGDEISLGKRTLVFHMDPMVHWPETMMSYLKEDKALFSGDLFGTEISHESNFADEMENFDVLTRDYFAIVMRPFAAAVNKAIKKVRELNLELLAPSHGPVYRKEFDKIINYYEKLSNKPEENKIMIVYCSIWGSSEKMADLISQGVTENGYDAVKYDLGKSNFVEMMAQAMTSKGIAIGSLTIIGGYHPLFETLFRFLQFNCQINKPAAVFGTHGWSPASVPKIENKLKDLKYNVIGAIDMRFGPKTRDDEIKLKELGKKIVEVAKNG